MGQPRVAGVVVTHGIGADLPDVLAAIAPQVDELIVVANLPGFDLPLPPGARLLQNERPLGYAANANQAVRATSAPYVALVNPDAVAEPGAVAVLSEHLTAHDRCAVAAPRLLYPDGSFQACRRRFPTVWGTLVRRTPLRLVLPPERWSRSHYLLDERPTEPVPAEWLLGAFWLVRREAFDALGGFDPGYRLYGEDIDFCYRAQVAGWERWYVPGAVVRHRWDDVTGRRFLTRRTIWHWRGILRFIRSHPERLRALR